MSGSGMGGGREAKTKHAHFFSSPLVNLGRKYEELKCVFRRKMGFCDRNGGEILGVLGRRLVFERKMGVRDLARDGGIGFDWVCFLWSGGAGTLEHLYDAIVEGGADAVLMASITHFENYTIRQMKEYLRDRGIAMNL